MPAFAICFAAAMRGAGQVDGLHALGAQALQQRVRAAAVVTAPRRGMVEQVQDAHQAARSSVSEPVKVS
jgi:hypothetical protein